MSWNAKNTPTRRIAMITLKASFVLFFAIAFASYFVDTAEAHRLSEKHYRDYVCDYLKGEPEYRLEDGTRIDCYLPDDRVSIEVEFQEKWAESIGQALYYSHMTGTMPVVIFVVDDDFERYAERFRIASQGLGIQAMTIHVHDIMTDYEIDEAHGD